MMPATNSWNPELYEARHAFVWQFGEGVIELLDAKPGEKILDLGADAGQLTQKIAERGSGVTGLPATPEMVAAGRQN